MKNVIIPLLPALVFSLRCGFLENIFNSKTALNRINEIENVDKFNVKHFQMERECGFIALSFYTRDNQIKKIFYSFSEGCVDEEGISLLEYFDEKGNPLKAAYHSFHANENETYCMAGRGNANFKGKFEVEKSCAELPAGGGDVKISQKFLPVCDKNITDLKTLFDSNHYCFFPHAEYLSVILNNELKLKKNKVASLDYFARGSFINSIKVNMRSEPTQKSESFAHLYPMESVKILEKGPEDNVEEIGKNRWYKVEVKSYVYIYQGSIYRNATSGWIYGTFLHTYSE